MLRRHGPALGLILLGVILLYASVSAAGFCGYDDYNEAYRAAFFDAPAPGRIITATHFVAFMYRPVTSALQLATWDAFAHNPIGFRLRNLAMHLIAIVMLYGIAFLLSRSRVVAAGAAAAFGVSPYTNQAVVVAIWTNTTAYAMLLSSLFAFLLALDRYDRKRNWAPALTVSFAIMAICLFTYEPTIVVFGMMIVYLALCRGTVHPVSRSFLQAFAVGLALDLAIFFGVRHVIGVASAPLLPAAIIARSMFEYCVAVFLPVDPVLGNALFGVPLPVNGLPPNVSQLYAPLAGAALLLVALALGAARPLGARLASVPWRIIAFCIISIPLSLVPIAFFREHVSEFNLYVPAALVALAVAIFVRHVTRNRAAFAIVMGLLIAMYAAGDYLRNTRVIACAAIATKIVAEFPLSAWRSGDWHVRVATPAADHLPLPFGVFNYAGIETIELPKSLIKGSEEAARLATGNDRIDIDIVAPAALAHGCAKPNTCLLVTSGGDVTPAVEPK